MFDGSTGPGVAFPPAPSVQDYLPSYGYCLTPPSPLTPSPETAQPHTAWRMNFHQTHDQRDGWDCREPKKKKCNNTLVEICCIFNWRKTYIEFVICLAVPPFFCQRCSRAKQCSDAPTVIFHLGSQSCFEVVCWDFYSFNLIWTRNEL